MSKQSQRGKIEMPMKVIFTDDGIQYFGAQGKKVSRFRLSDGVEELGIQVIDFSPATIQRLQMMGYISKFEMMAGDVVQKRKELIDLVKLLTYGMLYRQFDTSVFDTIVESELIHTWNRHNIKNPIDHKTRINGQALTKVLEKNANDVIELKAAITEPMLNRIRSSDRLQDGEKQIQAFLAEKYVDNLNPLIFFILTIHKGSQSYFQLVRMIQTKLSSNMDRSSIPEYLALMLVEVVMSVRLIASQNGLITPNFDASRESELYILCRISRKKSEPGDRGKLHFMISNRQSGFEDIKQKINSRISATVSGKSLKDFYDNNAELQENMHLGLYYLSYLSEACKKVGINFESFVNRSEKDNNTVVHLILTF